jgi:ABC-2 type transport system permease protein
MSVAADRGRGPAAEPARPPSRSVAIWSICRADLARLARDPVALFFIVVLPVVIIVVIGATSGQQSGQVPVGIADLDRSDASQRLVTALTESGLVDIRTYADGESLAQDIRVQTLTGGVLIPSGFDAQLAAGDVGVVTLLTDQKQGNATVLSSLLTSVTDREGQAIAAARFAAAHGGGDPSPLLDQARTIQTELATVGVDEETTGRASLTSTNPYSYTAPSNLVLFVFINSITGAAAFVEARQLGVTRRMLAAPLTVGTIVLGAGLTRFLIALLQSVLILAVGSLVFQVDWGNPAAAAVLVLVFAVLSTGAGLLVGSLARKPEQVPSLGIPIAIGFAMLGGCMWPLEVVPDALAAAGHLTPHAWAMDAWISLSFEGGNLSTIALDLAVLAGIAAVLVGLAVWRMRSVLSS